MLLGYNTNGLQSHRLDDALRLLADHGYRAVALTLDVAHLDPFRASPREVAATAKLLADLGLHPVIETGARFVLDAAHKHEPTLMTRDREGRARRLDFYRRCAAIGRDLGAQVLSFWSGVDRSPGADSWPWLCEGIAAACLSVRGAGLVPALEPEPGMAVARLADFERVQETLGADAPELTIDIGHLYVNETEPAPASIRRFHGVLAQVHAEDVRRGVHEHLVPGEGDVDFAADLGTLVDVSFRGAVCFELSRSSHIAPAAVATCRRVWDTAVVGRA